MRVQRPVRARLALEPKLFPVGGQEELDGCGVKAHPVIQNLGMVFRIDRLHRHHGHQNFRFIDQGRIFGEQGLKMERPGRLYNKVNPLAGDVHPPDLVCELVDLDDDNRTAKCCGLDQSRRLFGIWTGIKIAIPVGLNRHKTRDIGDQLRKITRVELDVGVDRPDFDLPGKDHLCQPAPLWAGIGKVDSRGQAIFEEIEVLGKPEA